jgi:chromosome segregation ATPase
MLASKKKKKEVKAKLEEKIKQINMLEQERQEVTEKLKKRETDLYKYKFKIKDLQKSKHVLTHRTTEMRASLEPKEQRIEDLKDQLLNLEKVFERQMQRMNQLGEELAKKQSKINQGYLDLQKQRDATAEQDKTIMKFA